MKKFLITLSLISLLSSAFAQLSQDSKIYLVTVSPGEELYSSFGHSAIWVNDPKRSLDVVFNYGTFDFNTPNFYVKFCMGKLDYMLSTGRMNYLVRSAEKENRSVYIQSLELDSLQKNEIYQYLLTNYKPENRFYRYDFLFDNCSTRIRDVLEDVLGDELAWNKIPKEKTFRDYLYQYTADKPWINFGFGLILGQTIDRPASAREEMFLPDELMDAFDRAQVNGQPLVRENKAIFIAAEQEESAQIFTPATVFWFLSIMGFYLSIKQHRRGFHVKWFDRILFFAAGIIGLIISTLWFFTEHHVTIDNWNIIWANPIHLFAAFFLFTTKAKKWHHLYYVIFGIACFFMLGFFYTLPQALHAASFPLLLYMCFRCFIVFYKTKKLN